MKTTNLEKLKRLRRYLLVKYKIWDVYFKQSTIQLDFEDLDTVMAEELNRKLIEIRRPKKEDKI